LLFVSPLSFQLLKLLHKVNDALKKYSHVNKKAVEQYNNFTKQRDQLIQRQTELEKSSESIQELIEVLDQRKDEAIERTFKQVSKFFEEVFEKLVPNGKGRLVMQRKIDEVSQRCIFEMVGVSASFEDELDTDNCSCLLLL